MAKSEKVNGMSAHEVREAVRDNYGKVAERGSGVGCGPVEESSGGCCGTATGCCGPNEDTIVISAKNVSAALGYSATELASAPEDSNLGLGCGNPQAIAGLSAGETVLDLGSGAGFDSFLAARAVGESGSVIGVDMTPQMIGKARANAINGGYENVEFRLGEIENLPVSDNVVDVIISNCVINLSPEKERVFSESYRVLKPGGRLAISDVVATADLPPEVRADLSLYTGCVSGAEAVPELEKMLERVGFTRIVIKPKSESREFIREWIPGSKVEDYVTSATIEAIKPAS
jgi:ubiquinone/menaquinone biosynthesis C-methylase UbiE